MHYFSTVRVLWVGPTFRFHKKNCNLKCNLLSVGSCVTEFKSDMSYEHPYKQTSDSSTKCLENKVVD